MTNDYIHIPTVYQQIDNATKANGFTMPSDSNTGAFLRVLAATKPGGRFLELGTGTGLATAWLLDGMDESATITSVDNDEVLLAIAETFLKNDKRLKLIHASGENFIKANKHEHFDVIFADTWPGKYHMLEEVLAMLPKGGIYIIDDMLPQPNWPEGHAEKAENLRKLLSDRKDLTVVELNWSTGLLTAVKK